MDKYDNFLMFIVLPIVLGVMIVAVIHGTKKDEAERDYYTARTHQIFHELKDSGCDHIDFSKWVIDGVKE